MQVSKPKAAGHLWWQCQEVTALSCSSPAKGELYPAWSALRSRSCILSMEQVCYLSCCSHSVCADCELRGYSRGSKDYIQSALFMVNNPGPLFSRKNPGYPVKLCQQHTWHGRLIGKSVCFSVNKPLTPHFTETPRELCPVFSYKYCLINEGAENRKAVHC